MNYHRIAIRRIWALLLTGLLLLLTTPPPAQAQQPDPAFRPSELFRNGQIKAVEADSAGGLWVLGSFDYAHGTLSTGLAHYDANGQFDLRFQSPVLSATTQSSLRGLRSLPRGRLLLLGDGTLTVSNTSGSNLLVLGRDGQPDPSFAPAPFASVGSLPVTAATQPDGRIVVGGAFTNYNGTTRTGLVRLLPNGQPDASFNPAPINGIRTVAVQPDGKILVGGSLLTYNGSTAGSGLLRLLADGTLDTGFASPVGLSAWELQVLPGGQVLVGGPANNQASAGSRGSVLRLLPSGTPDPGFAPISYPGRELSYWPDLLGRHFTALTDGSVVVAYAPSATGAPSLVRHYAANGQPDPAWDAAQPTGGAVMTVAARPGGRAVLGGTFVSYAGRAGSLVAVQGTAGRPEAGWRPVLGITAEVQAVMRQADGRLVIGGNFMTVNGWSSPHVARLWPSGEVDTTFQAPPEGVGAGLLLTLALDANERVLIGGSLQTIGSQTSIGVARLLPTGAVDAAFQSPLGSASGNREVRAIVVQPDGKIILGGSFALPGSAAPRFHVVRLTSTGGIDAAFTPAVPASGQVNSLLLLPTGELLVGGNIFSNGLELIRRLRPDGSLDPTFRTVMANQVTAGIVRSLQLLPTGGFIAAGSFISANNFTTANVVRLNADGTTDASFVSALPNLQPPTTGQVNALVLEPNGQLLVGGQLGGAQQAPYMQRLQANGQIDLSFFSSTTGPDGEVLALLRQPDGKLLVGGRFRQIVGRAQPSLIRLLPTASTTATRAATPPAPALWPNPVGATGLHLRFDTPARPRRVQLLDGLGRVVLTTTAVGPDMTLPTAQLPAGLYLLRAEYSTGVTTQRVLVR